MRLTPLFVCAALAWGCSGRDPDSTGDGAAPVPLDSLRNGLAYRCEVGAAEPLTTAQTGAPVGAPWAARGPDGVRVFVHVGSGSELHWRGPRGDGDVPASLALALGGPTLAWSGGAYLAVQSARLDDNGDPRGMRLLALDDRLTNPQPLRSPLPESACMPSITAMAGRVALAWHRRTREGCGHGEPQLQVLDATGSPLGPVRTLRTGDTDVSVRDLRVRWDAGHIVVSGSDATGGLDPTWVLSPDGETLWSGVSGGVEGVVACPRSGCRRVRISHDGNAGDTGASSLRIEHLTTGAHYLLPTTVGDVVGASVSGDRVLTLHSTQEAGAACLLTVLDVGLRATVAQHRLEGSVCDVNAVQPTPRGFVVVSLANGAGASQRIDCAR